MRNVEIRVKRQKTHYSNSGARHIQNDFFQLLNSKFHKHWANNFTISWYAYAFKLTKKHRNQHDWAFAKKKKLNHIHALSKCSFGDGTHFDKWFKRSANVSFKRITKTNKKYIGFTCQNRIFVFFFYSMFCFRLDWLTHTLSHTGSVQEPKIVFQSIISNLIITRSLQFLIALTKFYLLQPSTSTDCFGRGFKTVYIAQIKKMVFSLTNVHQNANLRHTQAKYTR